MVIARFVVVLFFLFALTFCIIVFLYSSRNIIFRIAKLAMGSIAFVMTVESWETNGAFQFELLLLLVSIISSFRSGSTRPFFLASGICLLVTEATMIAELSHRWSQHTSDVLSMATTVLSGMLFSTLLASVASKMRTFVVALHSTITATSVFCLAIGVWFVWQDVARPVDLEV